MGAEEESMEEEMIVLFSREQKLDDIAGTIMESFGLERPSGANRLHLESNSANINIDIFMNAMGEEIKEFIQKQKDMVSGFFSQIQDCDEDIKINLIHHIQQSNAFIPIKISPKENQEENYSRGRDMLLDVMQHVMQIIDGVLIVDEGVTALDAEGNVILSDDEDSDLDFYFPFSYQESPEILKDCTDRQVARRNENMKYLFEQNIYVCELPLNDDDDNIRLRSKEEVVRRTIGTLLVSLYSELLLNPEENSSVPEARDFIQNVKEQLGVGELESVLTEEELEYINDDDPDESTRVNYSWHYENLYMLEWILGLEEWNYPDNICDVAKIVRNIQEFESMEDMCKRTDLRTKKEILDKADLIYRMDWAAVDARIHGMQGPGELEHGVVQERHKTLNWMICFDDAEWDDVSTPT